MRTKIFAFAMSLLLVILAGFSLVRGTSVAASQSTTVPAVPVSQSMPPDSVHPANLVQLMHGAMFPNSNVIFAASNKNPADVPPAKRPSAAINPLEGTYGQWEAVENASLVIAETASLLSIPGRVCSNGRPVPTNNADWPVFVQGLRNAAMQSYKAAQAKDQDKILDATDVLTNACSNCHIRYRDKPNLQDRCH
jgi:hypothetical protein